MTREKAKELLPIIQAFAEGKIIQDKIEGFTDWCDTDDIDLEYEGQKIKYRIKPEQKYRPFETKEELWNEMLKHQPFGWVINENEDYLCFLYINQYEDKGFSSMFATYKFTDGTPFGIKEE